ncbi:MAG: beta-propeller domain-containing protein [Eubacterium sp.]|nr:beta-propeller domain-containing protein [Eubacterium sp.]
MKDKDFITSKFESENITAPESLSEENIKARLEQGTKASEMIKLKKNKKRVIKPIISVAACFAVVIGTLATANVIHDQRVEKKIQSQVDKGFVHFTSYDELNTFTDNMKTENYNSYGSGLLGMFGNQSVIVEEKSDATVDAESSSANAANGGAASHSTTYKQVDGVDEADIVKTDGKYIYVIDTSDIALAIYSADSGKTKVESKKFFDGEYTEVNEMFLDGDRIYVIGNVYSDDEQSKTFVKTLDISDKKNVKELDTYEQSGAYKTARFTGGCVYVISNTYNYDKKFIPYCTTADGDYKKLPASDICAFECCQKPQYVIVGAFDTKSGKSNSRKTKAIMGDADNVYCNTKNLYVACTDYRNGKLRTYIVKYSLDGVQLTEQAIGSVRGYAESQWAFDEKDGYLRVATTTTDSNNNDINKLFVLDEELNTVGSVGGYAKGEHIEAVKYIGDMAYVITYETTDPLFIIDLSDPKNPQITGKVKIDGFSTNLVPVGKDKLMGIGFATEETEWGESRSGVKLALFDISDKNNPRVLDTKVFDNSSSDAQYNHKAILQNSDAGYLAIPMTWDEAYAVDGDEYVEEYEPYGGAIVFTEKDGKIKMLKEQKTDNAPDRLVYIDDDIYTVSTLEGTIDSFRLK